MDLKEIGLDGLNCMSPAEDSDRWQDPVKTVTDIGVS
jgi:hypothetical protein